MYNQPMPSEDKGDEVKNEQECKCGIPGCKGHEIGKDGKVEITNHPALKKS